MRMLGQKPSPTFSLALSRLRLPQMRMLGQKPRSMRISVPPSDEDVKAQQIENQREILQRVTALSDEMDRQVVRQRRQTEKIRATTSKV